MSDDYTIKPHPTDTVSFHNNGKVFLTIKPDGTVIIPDDVLTDEAARTFWQVIEGYGPKKEITRLTAELAAANEKLDAYEMDGAAAAMAVKKAEADLAARDKLISELRLGIAVLGDTTKHLGLQLGQDTAAAMIARIDALVNGGGK